MFGNITKKLISVLSVTAMTAAMIPATVSAADVKSSLTTKDGIELFVAPNGKDSNNGSASSPYATIQTAINSASSYVSGGKEVIITVRGGTYSIEAGMAISALSGKEDLPFIIQGYPGEEANLVGAITLNGSDFSPVSDDVVYSRLPQETADQVVQISLENVFDEMDKYKAARNSSTPGYYELVVDGNSQTIARWPNDGWAHIEGAITGRTGFYVDTPTALRWAVAENMMIDGFFGVEYMASRLPIKEIAEDGLITFDGNANYQTKANDRYRVYNLIEELDSPGEYYIDIDTKTLYYYPPKDIKKSSIQLSTMTDTMLKISNSSNITLKNLNFCDTRGSGIIINENSDNIVIDDCKVSNIGGIGIEIINSTGVEVINSTVSGIGGTGIAVSGAGNRATLTSGEIVIKNNHIYDFAKSWISYAPGIDLQKTNVGTQIVNNVIHDSSSQAVMLYGNNIKVMYNEMYNVVNDVSDAGAVYGARDYTMRGNEVAYNYIHDIDTTAQKTGSIYVAGLYYDDMYSSVNSHHNILANCHLGIMIGGGRDHIFENNIIVDCDTSMFFDGRGVGWAAYHAVEGGQAYNTIFTVPYLEEPWASTFPELATIFDNPDIRLGLPNNNTVKDNLIYNSPANMIANEFKEYGVWENNLDTKGKSSYFKSYKNKNYEISESSGLLDTHPGLAEIDVSKIGLTGEKAAEERQMLFDKGIELLYPVEGQSNVSNLGQEFRWQRHNGSESYIVKIANDPEMSDVIMEVESYKNFTTIKGIPAGGKKLYWAVVGISSSPSLASDEVLMSKPRAFQTVKEEQIDKTELDKNLALINRLYEGMEEGKEPGTFVKGFKKQVKTVLDAAKKVSENAKSKQTEIEEASQSCKDIISSLMDNYNYEVVMMDELLKQQDMWLYEEGYYTWNDDGSITLSGEEGRKNHYTVLGCDVNLGKASAIRFRYNVNISSNYCVMGLQSDPTKFLDTGYNLIIKSNQIEIQKRLTGVNSPIKDQILNFYISDNKWVDLEMGAFPLPVGTYVYLMADGFLIAEFLDTEEPFWETEDVKFIATNPSGDTEDSIISIATPEDKSEWVIERAAADVDTPGEEDEPPEDNDDNKDDDNKPEPEPEPKPEIKSSVFKDVGARYEWAIPAIDGLYNKGIISGKTSDTYAPADKVTRAEFLKLIMGVMGFGLKYSDIYFEDVKPKDWYYTYVVAGSTIGLVNGLSDTYFGANDNITRQDAAVLISRAVKIAEKTLEAAGEAIVFEDASDIASYASEAINELTSAKILQGSDGKFNPKANCTRAEAAVMLKNVLDKAKNN